MHCWRRLQPILLTLCTKNETARTDIYRYLSDIITYPNRHLEPLTDITHPKQALKRPYLRYFSLFIHIEKLYRQPKNGLFFYALNRIENPFKSAIFTT